MGQQPVSLPNVLPDPAAYGQNVYTRPSLPPDVTFHQESPYMNTETVANYVNNTMYANVFQEEKRHYLHYSHSDRSSNVIIHPTYSSPDLNTNVFQQSYNTEDIMHDPLPFHYKPPPPYPRASNSTPDLAVQTIRSNVSDSPDLVSRKNLGLSGVGLNQSFENLAEASKHSDEPDSSLDHFEAPKISVVQAETDDASSDHSGATFHVKDTDSEMEETGDKTPRRQASKTKIEIKVVSPDKAPPPSTSKELITRRESFRRFMIARSSASNQNALTKMEDGPTVPASLSVEDHVIPEHLDSSSNENINVESQDPKIATEEQAQSNFSRRFSSRRLSRKSNLSLRGSKRSALQQSIEAASKVNVTRQVSDLTTKLGALNVALPDGNDTTLTDKDGISPRLSEVDDDRYHGYSDSSDSDFEQVRSHFILTKPYNV